MRVKNKDGKGQIARARDEASKWSRFVGARGSSPERHDRLARGLSAMKALARAKQRREAAGWRRSRSRCDGGGRA